MGAPIPRLKYYEELKIALENQVKGVLEVRADLLKITKPDYEPLIGRSLLPSERKENK